MNAIIVALSIGVVAVTMGSLVLRKYHFVLRVKSQLFKFHELRDRLQLLAIERKISSDSSAYSFLQFVLNLAIKNAGIMKRSEMLRVAKAIDQKTETASRRDIFEELGNESEEVQALAADMFSALYAMLIANDDVTKVLAITIELATHKLSGAMRSIAKSLLRKLFPERSKAAREAVKYRRFSERLANAA